MQCLISPVYILYATSHVSCFIVSSNAYIVCLFLRGYLSLCSVSCNVRPYRLLPLTPGCWCAYCARVVLPPRPRSLLSISLDLLSLFWCVVVFWKLIFHVHNGHDNNKIITKITFLFMIVFILPIVRIPLRIILSNLGERNHRPGQEFTWIEWRPPPM